MARIELRNCTVRVKDGFAGSAKVNQPSPAPTNGDTTLVIDTLVGLIGGGTLVPAGAGFSVVGSTRPRYSISVVNANEQQTVGIPNTVDVGTFTLTYSGQTTAAIAYSAVAAVVQTALENLSNIAVGDVLVMGGPGPGTDWVVEFKGLLAGTDVAAMTATSSCGRNEKQTVGIPNTVDVGTFTLTYSGQTTAAIAYNAVAAAVQTALENLSNIEVSDVLVTGGPGPGTDWVVEFKGALTITDVAAMTATSSCGRNEKQTVAIDDATSSGTFTLTYSGQTTAAIAYNAVAAAVQTALENLSNIEVGDVEVTGGPGPSADWVVEFKGTLAITDVAAMTGDGSNLVGGSTAVTITETVKGVTETVTITETVKGVTETVTIATLHPGAMTWKLTFTPALATADGVPADDAVITFLPQQIEIRVGDGEVKYTEANEYKYDKDRGELDTVREGDDVPMDVSLNFTFEHVKTGTSEAITPIDAIKGINGAAGWKSSSADLCEPYAVDIEVEYVPPCGAVESETILFPDFRSEKRDYDFKNAAIAVSGKCNATEPVVTRS